MTTKLLNSKREANLTRELHHTLALRLCWRDQMSSYFTVPIQQKPTIFWPYSTWSFMQLNYISAFYSCFAGWYCALCITSTMNSIIHLKYVFESVPWNNHIKSIISTTTIQNCIRQIKNSTESKLVEIKSSFFFSSSLSSSSLMLSWLH